MPTATVQWQPQVNTLTKPLSYCIQIVPRSTGGYDKMAADLSAAHPVYNAELIRSLAPLMMGWIQTELLNGNAVNLEEAFRFALTCSGSLAGPDDPLPADDDLLNVRVFPSRTFVQAIRVAALLERLPMSEKLPLLTSSEDTKLKLADVLNPNGLLRLTGSNLFFDEDDPDCGCVIAGTESGEVKQSTFGTIANTEILLAPELPAQAHAWNNEYTVALTTQYTEHGTPRTGTYRRRLRSPLLVDRMGHPNPPETGILSSNGASPLVSVKGGTVSADERLRIQAVLDVQADRLALTLLDMKEGGAAGPETAVTANGNVTVTGFSGSAVSSLAITVHDYASLKKLVHDQYGSRLVDILDVKTA
ncbi:MAG: DUF4469 domain-containing protein [Candidatus Electronema sp. V4]|uniref:DUF4469 domain-containing protein n=1 Tax=Candidatus Electronema sp. V4 TaxID=3454756 RepID=UPI00405563A7